MPKGRVRLRLLDDRLVALSALLYEPAAEALARALDGSYYDRTRRTRVAPIERVPEILTRLREEDLAADADEATLAEALERRDAEECFAEQAAADRMQAVEEAMPAGQSLRPYQRTGVLWLMRRFGAVLADDMGTGKDQPVSEPVLTPGGWRRMGDLRVGDWVVGADGRPTRVVGVFPQGLREQYRVTLTDGTSTRCSLDHLWYVETPLQRCRGTRGQVLTLAEIARGKLHTKQGNSRWFVPVPKPIAYEGPRAEDLPLHPYLLGALLANGCVSKDVVAHSGTEEQRVVLAPFLPRGYVLRPASDPSTFRIVHEERRPRINAVRAALQNLGVQGKRSWEKQVPRAYMTADVEARRALLAGLLDNDGTVGLGRRSVEYNTTSPQLAADVLELVRSLGGTARMTTRVPKYTYLGERKTGRVDHRVRVALMENPFRVPSKRARFQPRVKYPPSRAFASVAACGAEESVCIQVDAPDQLYVTNDMIVTHNTLVCLVSVPSNAPVLVVAPSSAKGVWRRETRKFRPQIRPEVLEGRASFRWPEPGEILITNYELMPDVHDRRVCDGFLPRRPCPGCDGEECVYVNGAPTFRPRHRRRCITAGKLLPKRACPGCHPILKQAPEGMVLIFDEAHRLKNKKSGRSTKAHALARGVHARKGRVWHVTGTPLENEAQELWTLFDIAGVAEEAFGSYEDFADIFGARMNALGRYEGWGVPNPERIRTCIQRVQLRRLLSEVQAQIPKASEDFLDVDVSREALAECDRLIDQTGLSIDEVVRVVEDQDTVSIGRMSRVRAALATAKIPAMLDYVDDVEATGEPLVVFSCHRRPIDTLAKRSGWAAITGDVSAEDRKQIEDDFQAGLLRGLACTIRAGGEAITLTRSNQMLFVDLDWKSTANDQAKARQVRFGQERTVFIRVLQCDHPLELRVNDVVQRKRRLIEGSVDVARTIEGSGVPPSWIADRWPDLARRLLEQGPATVRRPPSSDADQAVVDALHREQFHVRPEELLASYLAEQAAGGGLTEVGWDLARALLAQPSPPPPKPKRKPKTKAPARAPETPNLVFGAKHAEETSRTSRTSRTSKTSKEGAER